MSALRATREGLAAYVGAIGAQRLQAASCCASAAALLLLLLPLLLPLLLQLLLPLQLLLLLLLLQLPRRERETRGTDGCCDRLQHLSTTFLNKKTWEKNQMGQHEAETKANTEGIMSRV